MTNLSRRRFLTISAACAAFPSGGVAASNARWNGVALGAETSLRLEGLTDAQAAPVITSVEAEVKRLEMIFSLYKPESQISKLNRDGFLAGPAPELLDVLSLCSVLTTATDGAFDPTVQPLWRALAAQATGSEIELAKAAVGWQGIVFDSGEIRLPKPGKSALTLNGIAQGAITDRVSDLLKDFGLRDVLVDMGEIAALGQRGDGSAWRVGLITPDGTIRQRITLRDRAVATSAPEGTMLGENQGHILNPTGGRVHNKTVSVSAPSAAVADGLSTALCLLPPESLPTVLDRFPEAKLELLI